MNSRSIKEKGNAEDYILSPIPDKYITPLRVLDNSGNELPHSRDLIRQISKEDGICVEMKSSYVVDFGKYIAGYYKQIGGKTIGCGDFLYPLRYSLTEGQWGAFRYVKVAGEIDFMGVKLSTKKTFGAKLKDYKGEFLSSDQLLNRIWYSAAYTAQLCAMHHKKTEGEYEFVDGPKRDRRLFLWFDSAGNETFYYAFANTEVAKTSYNYVLKYGQDGDFVTRDTPEPLVMDVSGFTEIDLWELYNYGGDLAYLKKFYPQPINKHMEKKVLSRKRKDGLYTCNLMLPIGPGFKCSMPNQAYVYGGLVSAAKIAQTFKDNKKGNYYERIAEELKRAVNKHLWSSSKGAYLFFKGADHVDQLGNSLALVFGLADKEKAEKILECFKSHHWKLYHWEKGKGDWGRYNSAGSTDFDRPWLPEDKDYPSSFKNWAWAENPDDFSHCGNYNYCISPYTVSWEIEAHFKMGHTKDALTLTRRCFGNMLKRGPGTFWEQAHYSGKSGYEIPLAGERIRSACHRVSGKIGALLSKYILGITAVEPGFSKASIIPHPGDLDWAKGKVTTKYGPIKVSWEKTLNSFSENLSFPRKIKGIVALPKPLSRIYINKKLIWNKGNFSSVVGEVEKFLQDENYIYFNLSKGGNYHFLGN